MNALYLEAIEIAKILGLPVTVHGSESDWVERNNKASEYFVTVPEQDYTVAHVLAACSISSDDRWLANQMF
ncbi:hypothetical protein [Photobacterium aquae]|nr:hypothetical protein [Photobacterium aquae]